MNNKFEGIKYFQLKEFPSVGKLVLVKNIGNGWYGLRYLAENRVLVYGEYHENEIEPYTEAEQPTLDVIFI